MKSNQEMVRKIENFSVTQRTSDGFFDGSELLRQWNAVDGHQQRKMDEYLFSKTTTEFMSCLELDLYENNLSEISPKIDNQAVTRLSKKGSSNIVKRTKAKKNGNVGRPKEQIWMHPLLFIDFAMWINPSFKVKVLRFVYDEMIKYRNDAGDAYRELSSAIGKIVPADFIPKAMQKVAEALNWIVFGCHEKMARNKYGDENKQRELYQLEKKIADLINDGFINSYDSLISYLRKKYQETQYPKVFRTA